MLLWLRFRWIELCLAGLVLLGRPRRLLLSLYCALFSAGLLLDGLWLGYLGLALAAAMHLEAWFRGDDPEPEAVSRQSFEDSPALQRELEHVAQLFRRPAPRRFAAPLAPHLWSGALMQGGSPAVASSEIAFPVFALGLWTVFDLRCQMAHTLVRVAEPRWLFRTLKRHLAHIAAEHYQLTLRAAGTRYERWIAWNLRRTFERLSIWNLLADINADARLVREFGSGAVAGWLHRLWMAEAFAPEFLQLFVEPSVRAGVQPPLARGFASRYGHVELTPQEGSPASVRLQVLAAHAGGREVFDARPALQLFGEEAEMESAALRTAYRIAAEVALRRVDEGEWVTGVLLPALREDLHRNEALFQDRDVEQLPELVKQVAPLAQDFQPRYGLVLAPVQREAMIPDLLAIFLALRLEARGWQVHYSLEKGLSVQQGPRSLSTRQMVTDLSSGELSAAEFLARIRS